MSGRPILPSDYGARYAVRFYLIRFAVLGLAIALAALAPVLVVFLHPDVSSLVPVLTWQSPLGAVSAVAVIVVLIAAVARTVLFWLAWFLLRDSGTWHSARLDRLHDELAADFEDLPLRAAFIRPAQVTRLAVLLFRMLRAR